MGERNTGESRTGGIEKAALKLGIIPLVDCAPLVVAEALGSFERHGLEVEICREASWSTIRDKVALGLLDGAQMLAPMPLAATLGIDGVGRPMIAPMVLDLNGNAVTFSRALWREIAEAAPAEAARVPLGAAALRAVIARRAAAGQPPVTLATVFPFSMHNYLLRLWLAGAGIDPDRDLRLVVVPPPHMLAHLSAGTIDGYCVGEPWNQQAVAMGIGRVPVTGYDIWKAAPEKVLGVTEEWALRHPNTLAALIRALSEACAWLSEPAHRAETARILADPRRVNAPAAVIGHSLTGAYLYSRDAAPAALPDFHLFHRYAANFPWRSQADWILAQMVRWAQAAPPPDARAVADRVFRSDLYRAAVQPAGLPCPTVDRKPEGAHAAPWTLVEATRPIAMGADDFFDGAIFGAAEAAAGARPQAAAPRRADHAFQSAQAIAREP